MYVTPIGQRKTGRPKACSREEVGRGCENVRNKELVFYSYEQRRMEVTFKGGQDSYRVAEPIMMIKIQLNVHDSNMYLPSCTTENRYQHASSCLYGT
jgi:hypothetical protein